MSRRKSVPARVVFDGAPLDGLSDGDVVDGISVFFAHPGSDADERIVELAEDATEREQILAVTSDKQLSRRLTALGVGTMRSGRFRQLLEEE